MAQAKSPRKRRAKIVTVSNPGDDSSWVRDRFNIMSNGSHGAFGAEGFIGALNAHDEEVIRKLPGAYKTELADYMVRDGGIYLRSYNVRLAKFAANSAYLQNILDRVFKIAHLLDAHRDGKVAKESDREREMRLALLAVEYGFKKCEKGANLEAALIEARRMFEPKRPDQCSKCGLVGRPAEPRKCIVPKCPARKRRKA